MQTFNLKNPKWKQNFVKNIACLKESIIWKVAYFITTSYNSLFFVVFHNIYLIAVYVYIRSNSVPIHWVGKPGVSLVSASIFHRIRDEKTNMIRYNFRPSGFDRTRRVRRSIKQKSSSNPEGPPLTFRGSVILVQSDLDISLSFSVIFKRVFTEYKSFKTLTTRLLTCGHNYLTNTLGMW